VRGRNGKPSTGLQISCHIKEYSQLELSEMAKQYTSLMMRKSCDTSDTFDKTPVCHCIVLRFSKGQVGVTKLQSPQHTPTQAKKITHIKR